MSWVLFPLSLFSGSSVELGISSSNVWKTTIVKLSELTFIFQKVVNFEFNIL